MAEPALCRMTVDEFLVWDDGTDTRYQLIGGFPKSRAPSRQGHRRIIVNLATAIRPRLRPPCFIESEAGIRLPHDESTYYLADLAVTCAPPQPDLPWTPDPTVIVEVLSPSTAAEDRKVKLPDYQRLPSVQEIVLVAADRRHAEVWRRAGAEWRSETVAAEGTLRLYALDLELPLAAAYDGTGIAV